MLEVLISGKLIRDPATSVGPSGKPFTTALVRVPTEREETVLVNCIAFGETGERLGRLKAGDAVSMAGSAKLSSWEKDGEARHGIGMTATAILSAWDAKRRRGDHQEGQPQRQGQPSPYPRRQPSRDLGDPPRGGIPFDDGVPF